jgi:hypothetical protein
MLNGKSLPIPRKALHMSFKKFSSEQDAAGKTGSADKPKEAAPGENPAAQPTQKPAEAAPTPKS